jgi:oligopeptide/dipeptide ABC transporter ATP-binding protein
MNQDLVEVKNLTKHFPVKEGMFSAKGEVVHAVDDVSFTIKKGETLGLVGESGCGKSTTGRIILRLLEPTSGSVYFDGEDIFALDKRPLRELRRKMQIIFQDPYASLNPRMKVYQIVGEGLRVHNLVERSDLRDRAAQVLDKVGIGHDQLDRYPHEFSGGQRQRIGIARALALNPELIIADEPVSALDVSIQAQVVNLLQDLQEEFHLTYLFIAHDLSVVKHISNRVAVMYLGKLVELAPTDELFGNPAHPYTQCLLSAIPIPEPDKKSIAIPVKGDVPSPIHPPAGCCFHTRCPKRFEPCDQKEPEWIEIAPEHFVSCHLWPRRAEPGATG